MIKTQIVILTEKIHYLLFRQKMSQEMKSFLGNLSWSLSIGLLIMPLMMLVNTLAGRFMGPVEYGKYNLILIINQFLIIFIFFGLDTTAVKNIAKAQSFQARKRITSAISNYIYLALGVLILLTAIAYPILLRYASGYALIAVLVSIYALVVSIKITFDLFIRGMENFKKQAQAKAVEISIIILAFLVVFIVMKSHSFVSFVIVICAGAIGISTFYFLNLKQYLGQSNIREILKQPHEGKLFFLSALAGTIYLSSDRFAVTQYLGVRELGIYSAYYLASFTMISLLTQLFTNVFLPATARTRDKNFLY